MLALPAATSTCRRAMLFKRSPRSGGEVPATRPIGADTFDNYVWFIDKHLLRDFRLDAGD